MTIEDVAVTFFVFLVGTLTLFFVAQPFSKREQNVLWIGFAGHVVAALAMVPITVSVLGGGDMMVYHYLATRLADAMRANFWDVAPVVIRVLFHEAAALPIPIHGEGGATGAMTCLSSLLFLVLGNSLYSACMAVSVACFFARVAIYSVFRRQMDVRYQVAVGAACILLPSVTFWCSAVLKEAFAFCGIGALFWASDALISRRKFGGPLVVGAVGATLIGVLKPYLLMPFGLGLAGWLYMAIVGHKRAPMRSFWALVIAGVLGLGIVATVGELFPRYSFTNLSEETLFQQQVGQTRTSGAANISLVDTGLIEERGAAVQLSYAPLALFTALFRPVIFEAQNAQMLVNGLETAAFIVLFVLVFVRKRLREVIREIGDLPVLAFCLLFVFAMAFGVGLATTNLGSLSRYRMPMMPFFAIGLVLLSRRKQPVRDLSSWESSATLVRFRRELLSRR